MRCVNLQGTLSLFYFRKLLILVYLYFEKNKL